MTPKFPERNASPTSNWRLQDFLDRVALLLAKRWLRDQRRGIRAEDEKTDSRICPPRDDLAE